MMNALYRAIPSVDALLAQIYEIVHAKNFNLKSSVFAYANHELYTDLINEELAELRHKITIKEITSLNQVQEAVECQHLLKLFKKKLELNLQSVINATGVVIHTNLGRSPLSTPSVNALLQASAGYSNLEFDLISGERGSRHSIVRDLLIRITKAEDALVVNNNAAAVMLVLSTLATKGETIISRGELVEVGGSFRIPDVMECSGSILKEVGTTNKTHALDYVKAINENTKALMRVHTSNFRLIGFTSKVATDELAQIAHDHNLPLIEDLGSGSFIDFSPYGLPKEPTVQEVVSQNVDVVTFSGDKLLGGPQAGIIVGKKEYIESIKQNQLLRALRPCKLTLATLEATLRAYLDPEQAIKEIPTLAMLTIPLQEIKYKATKLARLLKSNIPEENVTIKLKADSSRVGGGAFPEAPLPTVLIEIHSHKMPAIQLRNILLNPHTSLTPTLSNLNQSFIPPLIGRIENDSFALDVRTITSKQIPLIVEILSNILK